MTPTTKTCKVISSYLPFAPISWWQKAVLHKTILFDPEEHFQKMSYRNRYYLTGSNGKTMLTIPLSDGRNQRRKMKEVCIDYATDWQLQHWKTICSLYNRSPFFEFYKDELYETLYEHPIERLIDFNQKSYDFAAKHIQYTSNPELVSEYNRHYDSSFLDLRNFIMPNKDTLDTIFKSYHQVFIEKISFIPNLSILDLLFCEGNNAKAWLR